ncbi:PLP-dependent aminotransferase family protein [Pseudorhodoferax sp. Leaf267]|uniref:MocR-like pyridoxine biosynthesis transcription factor PdxR n=1 Tax=Pseudorhodoferax sp. Leaf267 TaxID=1736316 RepID=UPI0006FAE018|nr:PLP-dependent aminotransferase family protein [Pseudorhodoferax sp. Leaf267]KQP21805.1 DNA-binding protein [Pseudorhodoferax sp. Leaf267]
MPTPQALLEAPLARGADAEPLQRQLHQRLRHAILDGRLLPASRLPGSRSLAEALQISRNTVTAAYEQLAAEGFLQPDRQGTRVAAMHCPPAARGAQARPAIARRLAGMQAGTSRDDAAAALRPGVPALSHFPFAAWRQALDRASRAAGPAMLGYGDPLGEPGLRASIARHLAIARGVRCSAAQVVITEGAQEALALCVRLLADPGDTAWVEDPGYRGAKAALQAGDLRVVPQRVDDQGLVVTAHDWQARPPRLVYTTPSHQYPTGAVQTAARRLALIEAARRHRAWIIEDDYDSEFRHAGEPIGAMQGLVPQAPVLYVGTFSKTMFPALRLGFVVLPEALLPSVQAPLGEMLRGGHRPAQLALADFIESGQFSRHLGRMRRLYRERQQALRVALADGLRVPHAIEGGHSGLHLLVRLPPRHPDAAIVQAARRHGIGAQALSGFALQPLAQDNGLVLGYGNTASDLFAPLVRRLSQLARAADTGA